MKILVAAFAASLMIYGCCSVDVPPQEFRQLSLDQQIATWKRFRASRCGTEVSARYLDGMALHGVAAATAMEPFLSEDDEHFPPEDAAWVVAYVASHGADLRSHPVAKRLRLLAAQAMNPSLKKAAAYAVWIIDGGGATEDR